MSLSLKSINYQRSTPVFSSEPKLCVKLTGIAIISDTLGGGTMWDAILPINESPEPENIIITTSRIVDAGVVKDEIDELLNTHDDFAPVREMICDFFFENIMLIGHLRSIYNCESKLGDPCIIPLPMFVDNHSKGIVYFSAKCKEAGARFVWSYELIKNRFRLIKVQFDDIPEIKTKHLLNILSEFVTTPNPDSFSVEHIQASNLLNAIDQQLIDSQGLNDSISVSYKQSGTAADVEHNISLDKDELCVNWELRSNDADIQKHWKGDCKRISFKVKTVSGTYKSEIDVDDLPFGFSSILRDYSQNRVDNQMELLENQSSPDIFESTLGDISKGKDLVDSFSPLSMGFDGHHRKSVVFHTVAYKNRHIRVFWDTVGDCSDGFEEWVNAKFSVNHIKIEGIKFSYFPDSKIFFDVLKSLPDDFLEKSASKTRQYMLEAHEYFWVKSA
jgi:hypothetical protein